MCASVCVCVCVHIFMQVDSHMVGCHIACLLGHASTRWLICLQYMHCVGVWCVHVGLYQCTCGGALMALSSSHTGPRGQK